MKTSYKHELIAEIIVILNKPSVDRCLKLKYVQWEEKHE